MYTVTYFMPVPRQKCSGTNYCHALLCHCHKCEHNLTVSGNVGSAQIAWKNFRIFLVTSISYNLIWMRLRNDKGWKPSKLKILWRWCLFKHSIYGSCLLWVMSTEISVDIAVDTRSIVGRHSVDTQSILGRHSVDTRSTVGRYSGR